ncbi:hypothetical protein CspHIS471_0108210 [Cutaneotrichosporon sp. HIS471]|nr:hypothetical protein CspHIS471_0108210 [Cutaneotrichosporon sp. HIS471]
MTNEKTVTLQSGSKMPLTGLGLWKVPRDVAADQVHAAIAAGYRLLDGAADYANERECGAGVARAIQQGLVTREELFIVSKLWNTNHAAKHVEPACRKSLADWGLDYFDLYLIHMPIPLAYVDPTVREHPGWTNEKGETETERSPIHLTWGAMETCHAKGLARNIGVSNFCSALIVDLMCYANVHPQVLQIEMHPYFVQQGMIDVCKVYGIHLMAYSSFGPASWVELDHPATKALPSLLTLEAITAMAKIHNATPAQVLLRWATQRGITVIPKSSNPARLKENLANTDLTLSNDEMNTISGLDKNFRIAAGGDPRINIWA